MATALQRAAKLRTLAIAGRVEPSPPDEPSDDELLRYLDGAMADGEQAAFERRLQASPQAAARIEILADALHECGWPVDDE
jgi:hypothetical protein